MEIKNRVLVNRVRTALHGGSLALVDFQFTPPFGNNIVIRVLFSGVIWRTQVWKFGPSITPRPNECGEERVDRGDMQNARCEIKG